MAPVIIASGDVDPEWQEVATTAGGPLRAPAITVEGDDKA